MSMKINQNITPADYMTQPQKTDSPQEETIEKNSSSKEQTAQYKRINKDGDTLELSTAGKAKIPISDARLVSYSESRLKQMYSRKEITKQQYDKAIKNKTK